MLPLTVLLATVTAIALLWSAAILTRPTAGSAPAASAARAANAEVVRRFYAAADRALQIGDDSALRAIVAPGFVAHSSSATEDSSLSAYVRRLDALRAACPDCTLDAEAIVVDGDRAAARVVARGAWPRTFLGLPLAGPPVAWTAHDLLRIADGKVAEHASRTDPIAAPQPLFEDVPVLMPGGPVVVQVTHLTLQPGSRLALGATSGPILVAAASGSLSLSVASELPVHPSGRDLGAGESVVVPAGIGHQLANRGSVPVEALAVAVFTAYSSDPAQVVLSPTDVWRDAVADGATIRIVGTRMALFPIGQTARLSAGWLDLPAGAGIGPHQTATVELIAVAAGVVAVTATGVDFRLSHTEILDPTAGHLTAGDARARGEAVVLEAGESATGQGGSVDDLRSHQGQPARLLLVRLVLTGHTP
jgi:predicted ester cyclase